MKSIFLFKTITSKEEFEKVLENMSQIDIMVNNNLIDSLNNYDLDDSTSMVICETNDLYRFLEFGNKHGLVFSSPREISNDLFNNKFDISNSTQKFKEELNTILYSRFDKDDVLDKILFEGIDSLTELDKKILEA